MARGNHGSQLLPRGSSRGRASTTSRGGSSNPSGKSTPIDSLLPSAPRAPSTNQPTSNYKGRNFDPNYQHNYSRDDSVKLPAEGTVDNFAQERLENAAKRAEPGTHQAIREQGRGSSRGALANKSSHSNGQGLERASKPSTPNPTIPSSTMANTLNNPFAPKSGTFSLPSAASNTFGTAPQAPSMADFGATPAFGSASQLSRNINGASQSFANPFGAPSTKPAATIAPINPFATKKPATPSASFGTTTQPPTGNAPSSSKFGSVKSNPFSNVATVVNKSSPAASGTVAAPVKAVFDAKTARGARFGTNTAQSAITSTGAAKSGPKPVVHFQAQQPTKSAFQPAATNPRSSPDAPSRSSEALAKKVDAVLRAEGITAPAWPGFNMHDNTAPGKQQQVLQYQQAFRAYQEEARIALMKAKLIDDPAVPKRLSEAIDFKGTCEEMCSNLERIERIEMPKMSDAEKENGIPVPEKMVKAMARSSAGQDAPLPEDIRSTAALRRTIDYLFGTILETSDFSKVHGFLWDRTRAVRRDFVFHSFMSQSELLDQVDCLERIIRFHAVAAHYMSQDGVDNKNFVEQQELEQLGKAFTSLMDTYEQCRTRGMLCGNEVEFRAYYVLWCARSNAGIIEEVQGWAGNMWEHEEIQLAVSLVEALKTSWDTLPIKPHAETDLAPNAFSRFFFVVESKEVSYTMACLAEMFFNHVRSSILSTLIKSYRRQKQQSTAWTIPKLNQLLHFDSEEEVFSFCEAYGINFDTTPDGVEYLSFETTFQISHPSPSLKQGYSYNLVEKKRGSHTLTEAINQTLYDESIEDSSLSMQDNAMEEEDSLFVKDNSIQSPKISAAVESTAAVIGTATNDFNWAPSVPAGSQENVLAPLQSSTQPVSIFDQIKAPKVPQDIFAMPSPFATKTSSQPIAEPSPPPFSQSPLAAASSVFGTQPDTAAPKPRATEVTSSGSPGMFSFLQQDAHPKIPATNNDQASKTATAFGSFNSTPLSQNAPPAPSFIPQVQPQKEKPAASSIAQSSVFQSQPSVFTGFNVPSSAQSMLPLPDVATVTTATPAAVEPKQDELLTSSKSGTSADQRSAKLAAVSEWVALGVDGLMQHFVENQVELILRDTVRMFMEEEAIRSMQEAEKRAVKEADDFRRHSLATKFGHRWRENARVSSLKRQGRVARQARREFAESFRASKAAKSASLVEDFRASTTSRRRQSLESLLDNTGVLDLVHDSNNEINSIFNDVEPAPKRQRSGRSTLSVASTARRHRRGESGQQNPLRRSLMSDPTYLQGGSRIHLLPDFDAKKEFNPQLSGVSTDYFRLKARGISTLPDGTPLAASVTSNPARRKRSLDGFARPETPRQARIPTAAQSVPTKHLKGPAPSPAEIQALKAKARNIMADDRLSRQKRAYVDDDEELFERAKRVREQMDEGADWYRQELQRDTASRSVSGT